MNLDNILGALDVEPSKPRSAVHLKVVKIEDASPDFTTWDKMLELNPELDGSILEVMARDSRSGLRPNEGGVIHQFGDPSILYIFVCLHLVSVH